MSAPSTPKRPRPSGLTCPPAPKRMRLVAPPLPENNLPLGVQIVLQELVPRHLQTYVLREIKQIPARSVTTVNPQIIRHCFLMPDDPESVTSLKMILEMLSPTVRFVRADAGGDSNGNSVLGITFIWQKGTMLVYA